MRYSQLITKLMISGWVLGALLGPAIAQAGTSLPQKGDFSGRKVICDFDNDGLDDLAEGFPLKTVKGLKEAGAVSVDYASGHSQEWHQDSPQVDGSAEAGDQFGHALTVGNFNGDAFCDLAIGVPFEDAGKTQDAGLVNVLYGSRDGLRATRPSDQIWHQDRSGVEGSVEAGDRFGSALAAGDFNRDGKDDLAIGVPREDVGKTQDAGAVNVLYGSGSGLRTTQPKDQVWHQDRSGVEGSVEAGDRFGSALAAGDFNRDGKDDLAIGVPREDVGKTQDAGAVNVLYGSGSGLRSTQPKDQIWHQSLREVHDRAEAGDEFGTGLIAGDFNDDGGTDLAIEVPEETFSSASESGGFHLLHGTQAGLQARNPDDVLEPFGTCNPFRVDPRRALIETSKSVLSPFNMRMILEQAAQNAGLRANPNRHYRQMIDAYNRNVSTPGATPCTGTLNGFPFLCDRQEGEQLDNMDRWIVTALVNRLDMAPSNGAHCGQQRIVLSNQAAGPMFVIFEAQIENPHPENGLDACRPVAEFWAGLSDIDNPIQRQAMLLDAFLNGGAEGLHDAGFGPFISADFLGPQGGQIRTNNFITSLWTLREFRVRRSGNEMTIAPEPVTDSPRGVLWNDRDPVPDVMVGPQCRDSFLDAIKGLLKDDPAQMSFVVDDPALLELGKPGDRGKR